jgi:hypothetical protein
VSLEIEVFQRIEPAPGKEVFPDIPDRAFYFAFSPCPVRSTKPRGKIKMNTEIQKPFVPDDMTVFVTPQSYCLGVVVKYFSGYASKKFKGINVTF